MHRVQVVLLVLPENANEISSCRSLKQRFILGFENTDDGQRAPCLAARSIAVSAAASSEG
jgi:hypothetical protein